MFNTHHALYQFFSINIILLLILILCADGNDTSNENSQNKNNNKYCPTINAHVPSIESTCWKWNKIMTAIGNIDTINPQKGCDNKSCQDSVCACDPYCCEVSWDLSCRGYNINTESVDEFQNDNSFLPVKDNYNIPGCSASIVCCEELLYDIHTNTSSDGDSLNYDNSIIIKETYEETIETPINYKKPLDKTSTTTTIEKQPFCDNLNAPSPSIESTCWNYNQDINDNWTPKQKGCDDKICEDAVCACDPYCCDVSWDESCRGYSSHDDSNFPKDNPNVVGCSASILCCEEYLLSNSNKESSSLEDAIQEIKDVLLKSELVGIPHQITTEVLDQKESIESYKQQPYCNIINGLIPSIDSTCWNFNSINTTDIIQQGCDSKSCENAVCACDSYCCSTSWDEACRGYSLDGEDTTFPKDNPNVPGCSASILCCEKEHLQSNINEYSNTVPQTTSSSAKPCASDKSIIGYDTIQSLLHDMNQHYYPLDKNTTNQQVFVLCPRTTFELKSHSITFPQFSQENSNSNSIIILLCGKSGSRSDECIIDKGDHHIIFPPHTNINNKIKIQGITFTRSRYSSLVGWSTTTSSSNTDDESIVSFVDCVWKNNYGYAVIDIYGKSNAIERRMESMGIRSNYLRRHTDNNNNSNLSSSSRQLSKSLYGMHIHFDNCIFSNNAARLGIFLITYASANITNSIFIENSVDAILIGVAKGASLSIDSIEQQQKIKTNTIIANNTSGFSTVFVDSQSILHHPNNNISETKNNNQNNNYASKCSNIFIEQDGSTCLDDGAYSNHCYGSCSS